MKYSCDKLQFLTVRRYTKLLFIESILVLLLVQCSSISAKETKSSDKVNDNSEETISDLNIEKVLDEKPSKVLKLGIERTYLYLNLLRNKRVGVVSNQTGMIGSTHLVDTLLGSGISVNKVFAPEHGFRGKASAGEYVSSTTDAKTGLPIISLYGNNKKPSRDQMSDLDAIVFDIQDVGVRFYTYISTLHYVMEACAEANIPLIVLDRPNPNGNYVDGPVLDMNFKSFVGMHPVPVVYGMTIGEYAQMINGENWLSDALVCDLTIVSLANYTRQTTYVLPIPPSPNLRNNTAIYLYPSLCFFEGTSVSVGRGTNTPFELFGHPKFPQTDFSFTPVSQEGASNPLWENKLCFGYLLSEKGKKRPKRLRLNHFIQAYKLLENETFVTNGPFLSRLYGNDQLLQYLARGLSEDEIRETWEEDLEAFKITRSKYLIY